jgi:hypothetical protein
MPAAAGEPKSVSVVHLAGLDGPPRWASSSIIAKGVTWDADTFLVYTPDAVLSRVLRPLCSFRWGYAVRDGAVQVKPLTVALPEAWRQNLPDLRERFTSWTFEENS